MGMAQIVDAPVLLVGDIDRGGVFAQLLGTLMLLEPEEKERVKGLIINKFRGDETILDPGIEMLENKGNVPVVGVVPYMELSLEDEDSLSDRFSNQKEGLIDIAVIHYPRISNFTDFNVFEQMEEVSVRYVTSPDKLHDPDLIILPGSKNTMADLLWMRQNGLEAMIKRKAASTPVWGICGGYQMLGDSIDDPASVEEGGFIRGMELLKISTVLNKQKIRSQVKGKLQDVDGTFSGLCGLSYEGYEIHMGRSYHTRTKQDITAPVVVSEDAHNIYGTYIHGIFDKGEIASAIIRQLAMIKGVSLDDTMEDYRSLKEKQYDKLADTLRSYLDMEEIYEMLRESRL